MREGTGRDRLRESGDERAMVAAIATTSARLPEPRAVSCSAGGQSAWVGRLRREHDNLRAALASGLPNRITRVRPRARGEPSPVFWFMQGHLGEARRWLSSVLDRPSPDTREARRRWRSVSPRWDSCTVLSLGRPSRESDNTSPRAYAGAGAGRRRVVGLGDVWDDCAWPQERRPDCRGRHDRGGGGAPGRDGARARHSPSARRWGS